MNGSEKDELKIYKIYVAEHLSPDWQQTFSSLVIRHIKSGTCITGIFRDQSELYGLIRMVFNMGLTLEAVVEEKSGE